MEKYQCSDTGAHFEFLDMCRRVKKLQTRRVALDKVFEEEDRRKEAQKVRRSKESSSSPTANGKTTYSV
jgi:hypothetical protein